MRSVACIFRLLLLACLEVAAQTRSLRPDDMFQLRRVGAAAWSPNGQYASIEISKPSRWLDGVSANDLLLVDVKTRAVRPLNSKSSAYIGYFNAIWSPDSKRVAFLSVDRNAVVRAWVWTVGTATASMVPNLEPRIGLGDPPIAWIDGDAGLITQTRRFRSAIASAGFSNFASLYGTFYGQYRHGDSGRAEAAQVLRMLQTEKGVMGMSGPPWKEPDRYRENSSIYRADKVETPVLLIHGELDFIPIQQAEEFFTALFRQDKRVTLLRYAGEGHTIADRTNVLDLWQRMEKWLADTMAPKAANTRR